VGGGSIEGCGSEVWLRSRVLCQCEARCEVLVEYGAGSGEHEDKQSRRRRVLIVGFAVR